MSGTTAGGLQAAITNKKRYGEDIYRKRGAAGGKISKGGGFTGDSERAAILGKKGGTVSRRTGVKNGAKQR